MALYHLFYVLLIYLFIIGLGTWIIYESKTHKIVDRLLNDALIKGLSIVISLCSYIPFIKKKIVTVLSIFDFFEKIVLYGAILTFLSVHNMEFVKIIPFLLLTNISSAICSISDIFIRDITFPYIMLYRTITITIEIIRELNDVFGMCITIYTINNHKIIHPFHIASFGYATTLDLKNCIKHIIFETTVKLIEYYFQPIIPLCTILIFIHINFIKFRVFVNRLEEIFNYTITNHRRIDNPYRYAHNVHLGSVEQQIAAAVKMLQRDNTKMKKIKLEKYFRNYRFGNNKSDFYEISEHTAVTLVVKYLVKNNYDMSILREVIRENKEEHYCYNGRIGHIINSLSGIHPKINISINETEHIAGIMSHYRTLGKSKETLLQELYSRNFSKKTIDEWIEHY